MLLDSEGDLYREVRRKPGVERILASMPAPVAAVAVVTNEGIIVERVDGTADLTIDKPATLGHWWDLASLAKHLVTTPAVADLVYERCLTFAGPFLRKASDAGPAWYA